MIFYIMTIKLKKIIKTCICDYLKYNFKKIQNLKSLFNVKSLRNIFDINYDKNKICIGENND